MGFYVDNSTSNGTTPEALSSYFASVSATIPTTLPNAVFSTPTSLSTPSYAFDTSVDAATGAIMQSELANSMYSPILQGPTNVSALPLVTPNPTAQTFIVTSAGHVTTSISTAVAESATVSLGVVPGWNAATSLTTATTQWTLLRTVSSICFISLLLRL